MSKKTMTEPHTFDQGKRVSSRMGFGHAGTSPWIDGGEEWQSLYNECIAKSAAVTMSPRDLEEYFSTAFNCLEVKTFARILTELFDGVLRRDFNKMIERSGALEQHVSNCVAQHIAIDIIQSSERKIA